MSMHYSSSNPYPKITVLVHLARSLIFRLSVGVYPVMLILSAISIGEGVYIPKYEDPPLPLNPHFNPI